MYPRLVRYAIDERYLTDNNGVENSARPRLREGKTIPSAETIKPPNESLSLIPLPVLGWGLVHNVHQDTAGLSAGAA
jgi:hypothetical protein